MNPTGGDFIVLVREGAYTNHAALLLRHTHTQHSDSAVASNRSDAAH